MLPEPRKESGSFILTNKVSNGGYTVHRIKYKGFDEIVFKHSEIKGNTSKLLVRIVEWDEETMESIRPALVEKAFDEFKIEYLNIDNPIYIPVLYMMELIVSLGIKGRQGEFIALVDNTKLNIEGQPHDKAKLNFSDVADFTINISYEVTYSSGLFFP